MSQENVEVIQRAAEAWNADDLDAFLAELHPDVEWDTAIERVIERKAGGYHGHAGTREAWENFRGEEFGKFAVRPDEIRDLGDFLLLLGHVEAVSSSGRTELGTELAMLITFRDGKIVRCKDYLSHAEGVKAAGLRE
jgi:ketosteroid isomerase-like protein